MYIIVVEGTYACADFIGRLYQCPHIQQEMVIAVSGGYSVSVGSNGVRHKCIGPVASDKLESTET